MPDLAMTQTPAVLLDTPSPPFDEHLPIHYVIIPHWIVTELHSHNASMTALFSLDELLRIATVHDVSFYVWVNLNASWFLPISVLDFQPTPVLAALDALHTSNPQAHGQLIALFHRFEVKFKQRTIQQRLKAITPASSTTLGGIHRQTTTPASPLYERSPVVSSRPTPRALRTDNHQPWFFRWIDKEVIGFYLSEQPQMTLHGMVDDLLHHLTGRFDFQQIARTHLFKQFIDA